MMPIGTTRSKRAVALHERFACRFAGIYTEAIFASKEVAEVEAVHCLSNLLKLLIRCH
jgi:hypothetical protein